METFTEARPLVSNPCYHADRRKALDGLRSELAKGSIDEPTLDIVERFARLPCCYTLQSCYGHFMRESRVDDTNTKRVADIGGSGTTLHYRISYLALCIEDSADGRALLEDLKAVPEINPGYIQFGSADWFWKTWANSYVLQVSPLGNACQDHFDLSVEEALRVERSRDRFLNGLRVLLSRNESRLAIRTGSPQSDICRSV